MESLSLFDERPGEDSQEAPTQVPANTLPPAIAHLAAGWPSLVSAITQAEATVAALKSEAQRHGFHQYSAWKWDPTARTSLRGLAQETLDLCTEYAEKHFGANGTRISIGTSDAREMMQACGAISNPEEPDIAAYWNALEQRFGGGQGERKARQQLARRLLASLNLEPPSYGRSVPPEIKKDGVLFNLSCWLVEKDRYSHRGYEFHYSAGETIHSLATELHAACGYTGLMSAARIIGMNRGQLKMPFHIDVPQGRLSFYTSKATLLLPTEVALQIRAFIEENRS